jgi:hypothetical protein
VGYWKDCITEAFSEIGIKATEEQVNEMAEWVEGAHENIGMATGAHAIPDPAESAAEKELAKIKRSQAFHDDWVATTTPCKECFTTGTITDGWGRDTTCYQCDGKGRVRG